MAAHEQETQAREGGIRFPRGSRRLWLAIAALAVAAVVIALVVAGRGSNDPAASAAGDSTAAAEGDPSSTADATSTPGEPSPAPPVAAESPAPPGGDEPPPLLPEVALDEPVAEGGVTGSLVLVEEIRADGNGPGNIDGPALRVTVRLVNETDADLDLAGVSVNAAYGPDRTPASPIEDASQSSFSGIVPPGGTAEGVYVFGVPENARNDIRIEVGPRAGAPVMVFTGGVR